MERPWPTDGPHERQRSRSDFEAPSTFENTSMELRLGDYTLKWSSAGADGDHRFLTIALAGVPYEVRERLRKLMANHLQLGLRYLSERVVVRLTEVSHGNDGTVVIEGVQVGDWTRILHT
jgi:hypothetical protein